MSSISTEKLLIALENSGLLEKSVLDEVRRRVGKAPGKVDPRSVTKYLVQKKHLTVEQGLEFLAGRIPPKTKPRSAEKKKPEDDLVLADDLEVVADEDLEVVEDADLEVVEEDLEVVDEELEVVDESDLVEVPQSKPSRPAAKPAKPVKPAKPAARPKPAPAPVAELSPMDSPAPLDNLLDGGGLASQSLDTAGATVAVPRLGKAKKAKKGNVWDSPLLLIGGGSLLALIIAGIVLASRISGASAEDTLKAAEEDYQNGSYTQAVHKFDKYLTENPKHKGVSAARVHRGLAYMRQMTEGGGDWTKALAASQETLETISSEKEFPQARAELAALLPKIAEGLAEQARKRPDQVLVDKAGEAMALVEKYVPKSQRPGEQLKTVENSLELTRRQLGRAAALAKALAGIEAAVAANEPAKAYEVRKELVRLHPDLGQDNALEEAIRAVSQAERKHVSMVTEARNGVTEEAASPILATTTLVSRRQGEVAEAAGRMVFALAEGSAYGIEAANGRVAWRRHVGYDSLQVPRMLARAAAKEAVLIDSVRRELVCLEAATGKLRWRHPLGEVCDAEPLMLRSRIAVPLRDGRLVLVEADSGNSPGFVRFPHKLIVAPAVDARERRLYQVAEHSNLYVVSLPDGRCDEVIYTGHEQGTIRVPPLCVGRYVILAENSGAKHCNLRVFLANDDGLDLKLVQTEKLEGHVHVSPQLSGSKTVVVTTDRGGFYAFDIGSPDKKEPFTKVATLLLNDSKSTVRFALARGAELWVADQQLTKYDVQASANRMSPRWVQYKGDVFLQGLEEVDKFLIHVRRKHGLPGVAIAAVSKSDGKEVWDTHLAAPLAGAVAYDATRNSLTGLNLMATPFQVAADAASSVQDGKSAADERTLQNIGAGAGSVALPGGQLASLLGTGAPNLWVVEPGQPPKAQDLRLPFPAAAAPAVLQGHLLVPTLAGEVVVRDFRGLPAIEPFQPKLEAGAQIAWLRPTVTEGGDILIADGALRLYRLVVEDQPKKHLEAKATAELVRPITTPVAVVEQTAFAADAVGQLGSYQLPSLSPGKEWSLGSPVAWGPVAVGDCVIVSTRGNQLYCFDGGPSQRWKAQLADGPLAGDPLLLDGKLILASQRGVVWSVNPADGQESGRVELGQPLASGPVAVKQELIVAGPDGALHRIARP